MKSCRIRCSTSISLLRTGVRKAASELETPANAVRTRAAKGELRALGDCGAAEDHSHECETTKKLEIVPKRTILLPLKSSCQKTTYRRC